MAIAEAEVRPNTAHGEIVMGSERGFAAVFTAVFMALALWPVWHRAEPRWWLLALAAATALTGLVTPQMLRPLNVAWFKFGLLLSRIMTPIVMGVIFFLVVTPTALIMRARGADLLKLRIDRGAKSYWIERTPAGPDPKSMRNQY